MKKPKVFANPIDKKINNNENVYYGKTKQEEVRKIIIDELGKKGVSILENNVTIEFVNNKCIISGIIVTEELISVPSELIIIEQGETQ